MDAKRELILKTQSGQEYRCEPRELCEHDVVKYSKSKYTVTLYEGYDLKTNQSLGFVASCKEAYGDSVEVHGPLCSKKMGNRSTETLKAIAVFRARNVLRGRERLMRKENVKSGLLEMFSLGGRTR